MGLLVKYNGIFIVSSDYFANKCHETDKIVAM